MSYRSMHNPFLTPSLGRKIDLEKERLRQEISETSERVSEAFSKLSEVSAKAARLQKQLEFVERREKELVKRDLRNLDELEPPRTPSPAASSSLVDPLSLDPGLPSWLNLDSFVETGVSFPGSVSGS